MNLEYTYFEDVTAEKIMEAFRLYNTTKYRFIPQNPWILYGIADKEKDFFFTRSTYSRKDKTFDYIFAYGNSLGHVKCTFELTAEISDGKRISKIENLEILEINGNTELDENQLKEIITFYETKRDNKIDIELEKKLNLKSFLFSNLNIFRQHEIILKNIEKWADKNETLAHDYIFEPFTENDKKIFMECIENHSIIYKYYNNYEFDYYMTDPEHSFKMVLCGYVSDSIKRCDEPDDYEFAIITKNTSGTILVWKISDFQNKSGTIPISDEKLISMIDFYKSCKNEFTELFKAQVK